MTFEGAQLQGSVKIGEKLAVSILIFCCIKTNMMILIFNNFLLFCYFQALTFQKINRAITAIDSQPTFDGGVLINVLGRLQVSQIIGHSR